MEGIEALRTYFEGQAEEAADVIEVGDYVRIDEDADVGESQDLIYLQDIQAVGVVRDYFSDLTGSYVEFPSGVFGLVDDELYLVDVDALHGEMEEMIAEETAEEIEAGDLVWIKPYELSQPTPETSMLYPGGRAMANRAICRVYSASSQKNIYRVDYPFTDIGAFQRFDWYNGEQLELVDIDALTIAENSDIPEAVELVGELLIQKSLHESVVKTYEVRLNEHKQALEETTAGIHELCRMLNIGVTWSDVPGLTRNPHDLLAQITKSVLSLKDKVKLAKPYVGAVDSIHRTLCDVPDGYEFTVVERAIFDMAEDTLMGIAGAANGGDESA